MVRKEKSAATAFVESAERVEWVEVVLRNGMTYQGNVLRNPIRRTGAIVNALERTRGDKRRAAVGPVVERESHAALAPTAVASLAVNPVELGCGP